MFLYFSLSSISETKSELTDSWKLSRMSRSSAQFREMSVQKLVLMGLEPQDWQWDVFSEATILLYFIFVIRLIIS